MTKKQLKLTGGNLTFTLCWWIILGLTIFDSFEVWFILNYEYLAMHFETFQVWKYFEQLLSASLLQNIENNKK